MLGGEILDKVARENLPEKVIFEKDLEEVRKLAVRSGGGILRLEEQPVQRS